MIRRLSSFAIVLLLAAGSAMASPMETVLTSDSTLYAVDPNAMGPVLELTRRVGTERESILVPGSADATLEDSDARLAWDTLTETLFVAWHRRGEGTDEIVLSSMSEDGQWSDAVVIAGDATVRHEGLQIVLSRAAAEGEQATLVHAVWWSVSANDQRPQYALVAFNEGSPASSERMALDDLAGLQSGDQVEAEETGKAVHPPLAMERSGSGVEIVFGGAQTTTLTRVRVSPVLKIAGEARIWKPIGRMGGRVPSARLMSLTSDPVQAFMIGGRIVLYTPDAAFRYVVFDDGKWSPARMIALDEKLTSDSMLHELRKAIETHTDPDNAPE